MSISAPTIITRSEWGASPLKGNPVAQPHYRFLTLHHAAGFSASDVDEGKIQVKRIQRLHQEGNGWADIGYHFLIDAAGNIYQGRPYMKTSLCRSSHASSSAPMLLVTIPVTSGYASSAAFTLRPMPVPAMMC